MVSKLLSLKEHDNEHIDFFKDNSRCWNISIFGPV